MFRIISNIRSSLRCFLPQSHDSIPPTSFFYSLSLSSPFFPSQLRHKHEDAYGEDSYVDPNRPPRLLVVQPRLRPDALLKNKLNEALNLANSLEEQRDGYFDTEFSEKELPPHVIVPNPAYRVIRADKFFGPGAVDTIQCHLNAAESQSRVDAVFVNAILTGVQQRNLERVWGKPVLDRVGLIIEIFHAHAQTKEAKLQAELAALMYKRSRLVRIRGIDGRSTFGSTGEAEVVSARGRGSGGRGFISGAGETELQLQRRRISERRTRLLCKIEEVRRTRAVQRAARKRHGGSHGQDGATVAIVGYTNAGKSTLVSALSETDLFCDDRLFATVDPKLRSVILPSGKKVFLSDTVGFISELPVQLVEAFHATLEEVVEADLLVHVLDSSAPDRDEQRESVLQVLKQIGVSEEKLQNMIEVWNKIDLEQEENEGNSCSGIDDEENALEELSGEDVDEFDDKENKLLLGYGSLEEAVDEKGDYSDSWLSPGCGEVTWDDQNASFLGWETVEDQQKDFFNDSKMSRKDVPSQPEFSPDARTSAIMGVGLQELLKLIDDKLQSPSVVERSSFDRKWRPPRTEDTGVVVGQLPSLLTGL